MTDALLETSAPNFLIHISDIKSSRFVSIYLAVWHCALHPRVLKKKIAQELLQQNLLQIHSIACSMSQSDVQVQTFWQVLF